MSDPSQLRVLVLDPSPQILADYRRALERHPSDQRSDGLSEEDAALFGLVGPPSGFPDVAVTTCGSAVEAIAAVESGLKARTPYLVVFLEVSLGEPLDGLRAGHAIRQLDPGLPLVFVSATAERHPLELAQQIPPLDLLFFLCKPFHAFEIQQLALALSARRRAEQSLGARVPHVREEGQSSSLQLLAQSLPAGLMIFDRHDRLVLANDRVVDLLSALAEAVVVGASYEEIFTAIAERLVGPHALVNREAWLRERLAWHAKSGGVSELRLPRGHWILIAEGSGSLGETYCLCIDLTRIKQRDDWRASRRRVDQVVASLDAQLAVLAPSDSPEPGLATETAGPGPGRAGKSPKPEDKAVVAAAVADLRRLLSGAQMRLARLSGQGLGMPELFPAGQGLRRLMDPSGSLGADLDRCEFVVTAGSWPVLVNEMDFAEAVEAMLKFAIGSSGESGTVSLVVENCRLSDDLEQGHVGLRAGDYLRVTVAAPQSSVSPQAGRRMMEPYGASDGAWDELSDRLCRASAFAHLSRGALDCDLGVDDMGLEIVLYLPRAAAVEAASMTVGEVDPVPRPENETRE